eukprot:628247_1
MSPLNCMDPRTVLVHKRSDTHHPSRKRRTSSSTLMDSPPLKRRKPSQSNDCLHRQRIRISGSDHLIDCIVQSAARYQQRHTKGKFSPPDDNKLLHSNVSSNQHEIIAFNSPSMDNIRFCKVIIGHKAA